MDEVQFGRGIKALRHRRRLRQDDLARAAGLSRGVIARIEQGHAAAVTVATLDRVARALGARFVCRLTWNGEGLDRLLDADHAAIVEEVVRILRAFESGWSPPRSLSACSGSGARSTSWRFTRRLGSC
ncbi:MAG: helix-turn-helix transcriptional regulator [Chloroflexi bacterium]|nr:MAG: helix-turn-helix transcriptional regulator [Chloroflexota bacterium]